MKLQNKVTDSWGMGVQRGLDTASLLDVKLHWITDFGTLWSYVVNEEETN